MKSSKKREHEEGSSSDSSKDESAKRKPKEEEVDTPTKEMIQEFLKLDQQVDMERPKVNRFYIIGKEEGAQEEETKKEGPKVSGLQ